MCRIIGTIFNVRSEALKTRDDVREYVLNIDRWPYVPEHMHIEYRIDSIHKPYLQASICLRAFARLSAVVRIHLNKRAPLLAFRFLTHHRTRFNSKIQTFIYNSSLNLKPTLFSNNDLAKLCYNYVRLLQDNRGCLSKRRWVLVSRNWHGRGGKVRFSGLLGCRVFGQQASHKSIRNWVTRVAFSYLNCLSFLSINRLVLRRELPSGAAPLYHF